MTESLTVATDSTEMANKDGMWLREISSCCCLTTAGKTRQLLLNKMYIPFLPSLYSYGHKLQLTVTVAFNPLLSYSNLGEI